MTSMTINDVIDVRDHALPREIALACEELLGNMGYLSNLPLLESCALYVAIKNHIHSETGYDPDHLLDKMAKLVNYW